jgi:nucleotide-binding universal stress UspA family protein
MIDGIVACLDGSAHAEAILPYARGIAKALAVPLTLLGVAESSGAFDDVERYLDRLARSIGALKKAAAATNAADAILSELRKNPRSLPALTTHGRTAVMEALFGSVALAVIRGINRPVLVYRPQLRPASDQPARIQTVIAALDGSEFSAKILPFAAKLAKLLDARFVLVQALKSLPRHLPPAGLVGKDLLESSFLKATAREVKRKFGAESDWEVLHGSAAEAISNYAGQQSDCILAMTSRGRAGLEMTLLGSVSRECLRHAGVPVLLYWPDGS